jgi:acylglycerol lipase
MTMTESAGPATIRREEGSFVGKHRVRIFTQAWLPQDSPRAFLLLVHGLFDHSGRYECLVESLVRRGFAVLACDHRGHGNSGGLRGYVGRFADYLEDMDTFVRSETARFAGKPLFVFGHSMGAIIATCYVADHQDVFAGMVVSGSLIMPGASTSRVSIIAAKAMAAVLPKMGVSGLDCTGLCRDRSVVMAYLNDPLVYTGKIRARLGAELLNTMEKVLPTKMRSIRLPILVLHGGADRLCNIEGSVCLHKSVKSSDKTLNLYDGFYHEILNEPGREQVLADIGDWLERHLTGGGT